MMDFLNCLQHIPAYIRRSGKPFTVKAAVRMDVVTGGIASPPVIGREEIFPSSFGTILYYCLDDFFLIVFTSISVWGEYQSDTYLLAYQRQLSNVLWVEVMRNFKARKALIRCKATVIPTLPDIRNIPTDFFKKTWASKAGGRGTRPPSREISGGCPSRNYNISVSFFLNTN